MGDVLLMIFGYLLVLGLLSTGCATQQGYQGAGVGAITGATAGVLIDQDNRWRGGAIGGGLGAILGGALTDRPIYRQQGLCFFISTRVLPAANKLYCPGYPYRWCNRSSCRCSA